MCVFIEIAEANVERIIADIWRRVKEKVENDHLLSSEKTLVFLFACELIKIMQNEDLVIDFENRCYDNLEGDSKYLDLLFFTNPEYKVAIEFKLPKKSSNGNSNQTQNRLSVYRDLARLNYLKHSNNNFNACYFAMAIDEDAYLNNKSIKKHKLYLTKHDYVPNFTDESSIYNLSLAGIDCKFHWEGIIKEGNKYICNNSFGWLTPIRV